ncbi:MAG: HdeA/HdeB family chaperone [Pseudomonadota bacterium]
MKLSLARTTVVQQRMFDCSIGTLTRPSVILAAALLVSPSLSAAQGSGPEPDEIFTLEEVSCKDLMGQAGDDRDRSISFLHGFVLGGVDRLEISVEQIIEVETVFFDLCLDSPTAPALATMRSAHGVDNE